MTTEVGAHQRAMLLKELYIYLFYLLVENKSLKILYILIKVSLPQLIPTLLPTKIHILSFSLPLGYEQAS